MQPFPFANVTNTFGSSVAQALCSADQATAEAMLQQMALIAYYMRAYEPQSNYQTAPFATERLSQQRVGESYLVPVARVAAPSEPYTSFPSTHVAHTQSHAPKACECIHCHAAQVAGACVVTPPRSTNKLKDDEPYTPMHTLRTDRSPSDAQSIGYATPHGKWTPGSKSGHSTSASATRAPARRSSDEVQRTSTIQPAQRPSKGAKARGGQVPPKRQTPNYVFHIQGRGTATVQILSHSEVPVGTHVTFDGDRGTDLGLVVATRPADTATITNLGGSTPHMLREATPEEVEEWTTALVADELRAVEKCNAVVKSMGLPLTVQSAAYQFDRQKLTFNYVSKERVDFRHMLHQLYQEFRCRIWMLRIEA